jgi:uncharacterized protein (DUF427 family)
MPTVLNRPILQPGPDHTLAIGAKPVSVRIEVGATQLAAKASALEVLEHTYPPALYVDREDVDMSTLERSTHTSWCPYKGEASYFHIITSDGTRLENAVWSYESPFDHIAVIRDHLGFYGDRVTLTRL